MDNVTPVPNIIPKQVVTCCISIRIRFDTIIQIRGMRYSELACKVGIDKANISRIVNGIYDPCIETKLKIAKILRVDSAVLFGEPDYFEQFMREDKE